MSQGSQRRGAPGCKDQKGIIKVTLSEGRHMLRNPHMPFMRALPLHLLLGHHVLKVGSLSQRSISKFLTWPTSLPSSTECLRTPHMAHPAAA